MNITFKEILNVIQPTTWGKLFLPCSYCWLFEISNLEKISLPKGNIDNKKEFFKRGLHMGHHFNERTSFPILKLLMDKNKLTLDALEMGSTRTPSDIYAKLKDDKYIAVEVGGITDIGKLCQWVWNKNIAKVWLYNYTDFVYIFKKGNYIAFFDFLRKYSISLTHCLNSNCVFCEKVKGLKPSCYSSDERGIIVRYLREKKKRRTSKQANRE